MEEFVEEDFEEERIHPEDPYLQTAREELRQFFAQNRERVFFSRQLEVRFEGQFYHWITNRALRDLAAEGLLRTERKELVKAKGIIHLYWHRRNRYPRRAAANVVALVDSYATYALGETLGLHGEWMIMEGFARNRFVMLGRETNEYLGRKWTDTNHNLYFIFERDGCAYGIEVKNTLGYMDRAVLRIKVAICQYLGLRPVMACRCCPGPGCMTT